MRTFIPFFHKAVLPLTLPTRWLLFAALAIIGAGSLSAQPTGYCSGLADNYACPEEPVKPDPALLALFTIQNAMNPCFGSLQFDNFPGQTTCSGVTIPANAFFIHQLTFPPGAGNITGATLQFRAKAAPAGQTNTDFVAFFEGTTYITGASLRQLAAAGGTWNHNQDATFTLPLGNLPSVFAVGNILSYLNDGDLDVVIGNETGVDWMCIDIAASCVCGGFSKLFARPNAGAPSIPLSCGGPVVNFGCPKPGFSIPITGKFACIGSNCPPATVAWTLTRPDGLTTTGTVGAGPYFHLPIPPALYAQPGTYTLALQGSCGAQACPPCTVKFSVNCPNPCPCDVAHLQKSVAKGFATALWNNSCKACFAPIALNDCDSVAWKINGGPVIGTTAGTSSFCHTFPGSGVNTVTMTVTRKKNDSSLCETFSFTKSVAVHCGTWPDCSQSLMANPHFNMGADTGVLGNGGASEGWVALSGEPFVLEGQPAGTLDGWSVFLSGNLDTADVLSSVSAVCIGKEEGTVSLRLAGESIPGRAIKMGRTRPPNGTINVDYYSGNNFTRHDCASCYRLASLDILPLDTGEWVQIEIPFNLSDWTAFDSCGDGSAGFPLRIAVHVSSPIGDEQGEQERYVVELDNLCVDGRLVSVKNPAAPLPLRLYPNPTPGAFTLELPAPALPDTRFRITDLTGRLVLEQAATVGAERQTVRARDLPAGLYFVQAIAQGQVAGVARFVKQ